MVIIRKWFNVSHFILNLSLEKSLHNCPTPNCECDAFSICFFFFLIKLKIKLPGACVLYRVEQLQLDCNLLFARMNTFKFVIGQEMAVSIKNVDEDRRPSANSNNQYWWQVLQRVFSKNHGFYNHKFLLLLVKKTKNTPMASTILESGLPICGLRPNHVCEVSRWLFQLRI
jgi:hypothetical protein